MPAGEEAAPPVHDETPPAPEPKVPEREAQGDEAPPAPTPEPPESWETRFRYLYADFENLRRRSERERAHLTRAAQARLIEQILPLFEVSQRAREAVQQLPARDPVRQGIELLIGEWEKFLRTEHVETVARTGAPFRAETMEAVAEAPASASHPSGSVVEIVQQGYRRGEDLLRPAKVVVARSPERPTAAEPEPAPGDPPQDPSAS